MPTSRKRGALARTIALCDVGGGRGVAEHPEREPFVAQRVPTLQALADVRRHIARLVPEPHQRFRYEHRPICALASRRCSIASWLPQRQLSNEVGPQAVVLFEAWRVR